MKNTLLIAALISWNIAASQDLSLPMKDNSIHYSNIVLTDNSKSIESIFERVNLWATNNTNKYELEKEEYANVATTLTVKGKINIDPDKRNIHNVDCEFNMDVTVIDGRYRVEVYNFNFVKAEQKFDASEVYKGYLKRDPFVKTAFESREAALERHQFLLERLQKNVTAMLDNLQKFVEEQ